MTFLHETALGVGLTGGVLWLCWEKASAVVALVAQTTDLRHLMTAVVTGGGVVKVGSHPATMKYERSKFGVETFVI